MNIQNIIKLLKSKNEDDILLGYILGIKEHSFEQLSNLIEPLYHLGKSWDSEGEYIKRYYRLNITKDTNWIKI